MAKEAPRTRTRVQYVSSPHHMDAASAVFRQAQLERHALVGREILVCWDDGVWYDAVVVCYYPDEDEYKLVYRADDGIEIAKLRDRRWLLVPKKRAGPGRPVLDGVLIEFEYPTDMKRYKAIVYNHSKDGKRLKIAYIDEHTTDNLKGGGWDFLTSSPCLDDDSEEEDEPREREPVQGRIRKRRSSKAARRSKEGSVPRSSRRRG